LNEKIREKLKQVRLKDLPHLLLFLLALIPAAILRHFRPHLWLVTESGTEARDNGYWLFRYLCLESPETDAVYAIDRKAPEYARVKDLGPTVQSGSFRHWVLYLAAEANISSQKYGKPNAAVCYLLEVVTGLLKNFRVFLQHGIVKDDLPFLHYDKAKFSMFCCAAEPEYHFVQATFGYPADSIVHVGLCRFDPLHNCTPDLSQVIIIPTWRMYLQRTADQEAFLQSDYFHAWDTLITDGRLADLLERYGKHARFCLHRNMGEYEQNFHSDSPCIQVLRWQDADISRMIQDAGTLITDFSSIYMDFAYQKKPVLYYQFDTEEYREGHLPLGYFDYKRDGFGPVCATADTLLAELEATFRRECAMEDIYRGRVDAFFTLQDDRNSERTRIAIEELLKKRK